jgi:hypothetical protein
MNRVFGRQGEAFVFGPRTAHHWHLYVVDFTDRDEITSDVTLELMMTDLDRSVMEQFYRRADFTSHKDVTKVLFLPFIQTWRAQNPIISPQ